MGKNKFKELLGVCLALLFVYAGSMFLLLGCSKKDESDGYKDIYESRVVTSGSVIVEETTSTSTEPSVTATATAIPKPLKKVNYNESRIKEKMSKFSYIELIQIVQSRSFTLDGTENGFKEFENLKIKYDTKNKVSKMYANLDFGNGLGNGKISIINDFKHNKHYSKENDGEWNRDKTDTSILNISHEDVHSAYDVYNDLLPKYKGAKKGVKQGNKVTFTKVRKAKKSDLDGIQYDKLLNKETVLVLKNDIPRSIEERVTFELNGGIIAMMTVVKVKSISNKDLKISEVK